MNTRMWAAVAVAVLLACNASAIVYVDKNATGPENGASWATAFRTIQAGINAAAALPGGDEVWVAQGVYDEVRTEAWGDSGVAGSLVLKDNVQLYGGFRGTETLRTRRSVYDHGASRPRTIIDGSVSRAGSPAYHVVVIGTATAPNVNVRLDGFGITGGRAVGIATFYHTYRGAGIYNWISSPVIANCMIYDNVSEVSGGGMANESSNVGGVDYAANATLINCVFFNNTANRNLDWESNPVRGGGGLFINVNPITWDDVGVLPAPAIINCTFSGNILTNPGVNDPPAEWGRNSSGIYNFCNLPNVTNSIVYANASGQIRDETIPSVPSGGVTTVTYSDIQGGWVGVGNIDADPLFTNPVAGNFILAVGSPCINTGTNSVVNPRDLRGVTRPREVIVEMGAFEHDNVPPQALCNSPLSVTLVNGAASITAMDVDNGSTDIPPTPGIDIDIYSIDKSTFDCADLAVSVGGGTIPVVLTVTDYANNSASCTAQVTVQGGAPYFEDPNDMTLTPDQGTPLLIRTYRGLSASFSITACGGNVNRQFTWYFDDGVNPPEALPPFGNHPRTASTSVTVVVSGLDTTLTLANVQEVTSGEYYCVLSDDSGNPPAVTGAAELIVIPPVTVTNPTPNITLRTGSDVSWSVVASGGYGPPYNYQWQRNVAGSGWQNVPAPGVYPRTMYPGALQYIVETEFIGSNDATFTILRALKNDGAATPVTLDEGQYRVLVDD
ncbi:MAG TPA: immunoglobulin domain-containing protein, partial [Candidatus Hydrogenedentes bacterium]|nr:immunoglobulin domain-containing protein [Candidatus Hydrogenedentota bacterium]